MKASAQYIGFSSDTKAQMWILNNKHGLTMQNNVSHHLQAVLGWIDTFLFIEPADAASIAVWFE